MRECVWCRNNRYPKDAINNAAFIIVCGCFNDHVHTIPICKMHMIEWESNKGQFPCSECIDIIREYIWVKAEEVTEDYLMGLV